MLLNYEVSLCYFFFRALPSWREKLQNLIKKRQMSWEDWKNLRMKNWKRSSKLRHDKTNKMAVRPAKTQISLGIRPVWSESLLSAWRKFGSLATHWAHSEDSDQTGWMPRLIWVFAERTLILLVLSCGGSSKHWKLQINCLWLDILEKFCYNFERRDKKWQ